MGALLAFDVPGNALPVEAISHGAGPGGKLAGASSVPVVARPDGAVAVLLDATIVRTLWLPAAMKLPGR